MSDLTIFLGYKNYSSWSLRAWLALEHCGVPYDERTLDPAGVRPDDPVRRKSPSGRVPYLRHGDVWVWDSLAICEYLAETFPQARLWPEDVAARAFARSACAEMHSGFQALRNCMPMNIRRSAPGKGRAPGVEQDIARITTLWGDTRARFSRGGDLLFGRFTIADAFFAPVVTRFRTYGVDLDAPCRAYADAVWALPSMQRWADAARRETVVQPQYDL
jgi:glutathione S-transferase